jgi:hypothetical protein
MLSGIQFHCNRDPDIVNEHERITWYLLLSGEDNGENHHHIV